MFKIGYDKKITMVQGDTGVIRMRIHNYELSQGDEVRFAIVNKANPSILLCQHSDKKIVLEKQVTAFEKDGSARIVIYPYDTEYLQPGKYLYEIQVKTKDGRIDTVVPLAGFTLMDGTIQGEYGQTKPLEPNPSLPGAGTNSSEIELRFKRLEDEIIPELGNRITNVEKDIDSVSSSLDDKANKFDNCKIYNECIAVIVDDDGKNEFKTIIKPIMDRNKIKCTLGIITDNVGTSGYMTKDELLQLQSEGYDIVSHTATHSASMYKVSTGITATDEEIRQDMLRAYNYLRENGFKGYDKLVYPWGEFGSLKSKYKNIAREFYSYALNANATTYINSPVDNMYLGRKLINSQENFNTSLKPFIDNAKNNNGWMIFYVHSNDSTHTSDPYIQTVIDYLKNNNIKILTLSEALEIRGNSLSIGDYDSDDSFYIGKDGKSRLSIDSKVDFKQTHNLDADYTHFKENYITISNIYGVNDNLTNQGGTLKTIRTNNLDFIYQEFTPYNSNDLYLRHWDNRSVPPAWKSWTKLNLGSDLTSNSNAIDVYSTIDNIMDAPLSTYRINTETTVPIRNTQDKINGAGGNMKIFRSINEDFCYATFTPVNIPSLYYRKWNHSTQSWEEWVNISNTKSLKTRNSTDLITSYPIGNEILEIGNAQASGFPENSAGILKTYRGEYDVFSYQEYHLRQSCKVYKRYPDANNSYAWTEWVKISLV